MSNDVRVEVFLDMVKNSAKKVTSVYEKIKHGVVTGYQKIENGVVNGYKKMENGVVAGFGKVTDICVKALFAREGESVEEAKERLSGKDRA